MPMQRQMGLYASAQDGCHATARRLSFPLARNNDIELRARSDALQFRAAAERLAERVEPALHRLAGKKRVVG